MVLAGHVGASGPVERSAPVALSVTDRGVAQGAGLRIRDADDGIVVVGDAQLEAEAVVVERAGRALLVDGAGARADISDFVARALDGPGALVQRQGQTEARRVYVHDVATYGAYVFGGILEVDDAVIRGVRSDALGQRGWGVHAENGRFTGRRLYIEDVRHVGAQASGRGSLLVLEDTVIEDVPVAPDDNERPGGLQVFDGGGLDLRRVVVRRAVRMGLNAIARLESPQVTATDLVIEDIRSRPGGTKGNGIVLDDGTQMTLTRARIHRVRGFGVDLRDDSTSGIFEHVVVSETGTAACDSNDCLLGNGVGIVVSATAQLSLRKFELLRNADVGLRAEATLGVRAEDGRIAGHRLGLWLSDPELLLENVVEAVQFEDNGVNIRTDR